MPLLSSALFYQNLNWVFVAGQSNHFDLFYHTYRLLILSNTTKPPYDVKTKLYYLFHLEDTRTHGKSKGSAKRETQREATEKHGNCVPIWVNLKTQAETFRSSENQVVRSNFCKNFSKIWKRISYSTSVERKENQRMAANQEFFKRTERYTNSAWKVLNKSPSITILGSTCWYWCWLSILPDIKNSTISNSLHAL